MNIRNKQIAHSTLSGLVLFGLGYMDSVILISNFSQYKEVSNYATKLFLNANMIPESSLSATEVELMVEGKFI